MSSWMRQDFGRVMRYNGLWMHMFNRGVAQKKLDSTSFMDLITFTGGAAYDSTAVSRTSAKAPTPPPAWDSQPATENRHRSLVPSQRLLRPRRPAAGQIRDAASGSGRKKFHQRVRTRLRFLPS